MMACAANSRCSLLACPAGGNSGLTARSCQLGSRSPPTHSTRTPTYMPSTTGEVHGGSQRGHNFQPSLENLEDTASRHPGVLAKCHPHRARHNGAGEAMSQAKTCTHRQRSCNTRSYLASASKRISSMLALRAVNFDSCRQESVSLELCPTLGRCTPESPKSGRPTRPSRG